MKGPQAKTQAKRAQAVRHPLKIIYVGNQTQHAGGTRFYNLNTKAINGFIRLGHFVYFYSDREIARASTIFKSRKFGILPANTRLVETCRTIEPDVIFLAHGDVIWNRTLDEIRKFLPEIKVIYRNVDPLTWPNNWNNITRRSPAVDAVFVTTAGESLGKLAAKDNFAAFIPNLVDASVDTGRAFARSDQAHDVFYAIGGEIENDERAVWARKLIAELSEMSLDFRGMKGRPPGLDGAAFIKALGNARMGLSISRNNEQYLYASDRMAQYLGHGLLTFIDRRTRFDEFFSQDELVFYEGFDELVEKLRHYRQDDAARKRIAEAGWKKAHAEHASEKICRYMLEMTYDAPLSHPYLWPTDKWRAA